jgi:hypothetical protein
LSGIDLFNIFWQSGMPSGPEYFRLGRRELFVCERARRVQLCEVFDLVGRVRRRGRILRLVVGRRLVLLVVGRRLLVGLLLPGPRGRVVSNRRSARHSDNERPPPYPSPETHGELLPVRSAGLRLSAQCASIAASPIDTNYPHSVTRTLDCVRLGSKDSEIRCARGQSPLSVALRA